MKSRINKMFLNDKILVYLYIALMWTILTIVSKNVNLLTENTSVLLFMKVVWVLVLLFGTTALLAVLMHLKKHKNRIYKEDIENGEKIK